MLISDAFHVITKKEKDWSCRQSVWINYLMCTFFMAIKSPILAHLNRRIYPWSVCQWHTLNTKLLLVTHKLSCSFKGNLQGKYLGNGENGVGKIFPGIREGKKHQFINKSCSKIISPVYGKKIKLFKPWHGREGGV